jgi:hypothetical protein
MRIGVISHDGIALLDHAISEDAMQIERYDDGNVLAEKLPRFRNQPAFGIELGLARHRSVHAEVHTINGWCGADGSEKFTRDSLPGIFGQSAA